MSKSVGILGCGWLGLPLAKSLVNDGYQVYGTTTSLAKRPILENEGIRAFVISLTEKGPEGPIAGFLKNIEVLVINVPPKLRSGSQEDYVKKIRGLYQALGSSNVAKIIFVSSTSVYGDLEGTVNEQTPPKPATESGRQILEAETILRNDKRFHTTIIRFGGLISNDRHPVNRLSGKKGLTGGGAPVNLIHRDDCISIIKAIIVQGWWGEIFNAVYPSHPSKKAYYGKAAMERGIPTPKYKDTTGQNSKKVDSSKLILVKKYHFNTSI